MHQPAWILPVNYLKKQESRCEKTFALLVKVVHRRRLVWDKENREMQCAHKLRQPSKYWFYPNCTQVFLETLQEKEERLKWNCHESSIQCIIHSTSVCRLFLTTIELPNRSLLDNWKTCHSVIWHTLYENHSHTFLMQRQIKEVLGAAAQACLCAFCVYTAFFGGVLLLCFGCLGVASPL